MNSLARLSKLSVTFAMRTPVSRAMISGSARAAGGAKHDAHGHDNHGHDDHHDDHAHHDHPVTMLVISRLLVFASLIICDSDYRAWGLTDVGEPPLRKDQHRLDGVRRILPRRILDLVCLPAPAEEARIREVKPPFLL
jgi:hypothetical protein